MRDCIWHVLIENEKHCRLDSPSGSGAAYNIDGTFETGIFVENADSPNNIDGLVAENDVSLELKSSKFKLNIMFKPERSPFVHELEPFYRAEGAMAAKFRSLYPRRVDMWFENFNGGSEQGHLNMGQVCKIFTTISILLVFELSLSRKQRPTHILVMYSSLQSMAIEIRK